MSKPIDLAAGAPAVGGSAAPAITSTSQPLKVPPTASQPPAPVVRRGRGTFRHQLRTEEMEQQASSAAAAASASAITALGRAEEASTIFTSATATVVLPSSAFSAKTTVKLVTEEEEIAAQFAHLKKGKDIPLGLAPAPVISSATAMAAAAGGSGGVTGAGTPMSAMARLAAAAEARASAARTQFGMYEDNTNDTARQLLFRGEKRRRYCVIVGDLQNETRQVTLKLFGHKGAKPFKLQNKLIRLVNLSIGRPRQGTLEWLEAHGLLNEEDEEDGEREEGNWAAQVPACDDESTGKEALSGAARIGSGCAEVKEGSSNAGRTDPTHSRVASSTASAADMVEGDESAEARSTEGPGRGWGETPSALDRDVPSFYTPPPQALDATRTAEERARQAQTHAAAGFDTEELIPSSSSSETGGDERAAEVRRRKRAEMMEAVAAIERAAAAVPVPMSDSDDNNEGGAKDTAGPSPAGHHAGSSVPLPSLSGEALSAVDAAPSDGVMGPGLVRHPSVGMHVDPVSLAATPASTGAVTSAKPLERSPPHDSKHTAEGEGEDVDHYLDYDDEVVPLTVQQEGTSTSVIYESSLARSPVLTARRFASLRDYFLREFRFLLGLEDVRAQNVSVKINLGAAYCCLARQGSYSTPLKHATFGEFVERMNTESMQLYFIMDCPVCVSRAVDMESGSLHFPASSTTVKITFFSNERQSRSIARAVWDSDIDQFRLLDVENIGVTFNWSVFSLDEMFVRRKKEVQDGAAATPVAVAGGLPSGAAASTSAPPTHSAVPNARVLPAPACIGMDRGHSLSGASASLQPRPDQDDGDGRGCAAGGFSGGHGRQDEPRAASGPLKTDGEEDEEDDLARNKTVAYPFEVEFRAFRRWKQQGDNPAAPLAKAILEELSHAEHNYLTHGSTAMYERMDLTNVCEVDYAAEDLNVESIVVEHTSRVKPEGTDLLVDNTTSLLIENFAAARQLKQKVAAYGPVKVAAMQNTHNNNYLRSMAAARRTAGRSGQSFRDGLHLSPADITEVLKPTSKLTFFRSRGSSIHWKLRPNSSLEENIAPMTEALSFLQQVLHTANEIERNSARAGAAPAAL